MLERRTRRFIGPRRTFKPDAVDQPHVVELDAVRAGEVRLSLGHLLEKIQPCGGGWEILVAASVLDIVALGAEMAQRLGLRA